jgi:hypothetical protein
MDRAREVWNLIQASHLPLNTEKIDRARRQLAIVAVPTDQTTTAGLSALT